MSFLFGLSGRTLPDSSYAIVVPTCITWLDVRCFEAFALVRVITAVILKALGNEIVKECPYVKYPFIY